MPWIIVPVRAHPPTPMKPRVTLSLGGVAPSAPSAEERTIHGAAIAPPAAVALFRKSLRVRILGPLGSPLSVGGRRVSEDFRRHARHGIDRLAERDARSAGGADPIEQRLYVAAAGRQPP